MKPCHPTTKIKQHLNFIEYDGLTVCSRSRRVLATMCHTLYLVDLQKAAAEQVPGGV